MKCTIAEDSRQTHPAPSYRVEDYLQNSLAVKARCLGGSSQHHVDGIFATHLQDVPHGIATETGRPEKLAMCMALHGTIHPIAMKRVF